MNRTYRPSKHNRRQNPNPTLADAVREYEFDAFTARFIEATNAMGQGRLPSHALIDRIVYEPPRRYEYGVIDPIVHIPFTNQPSQRDVEAVAKNLASFVSQSIGRAQDSYHMTFLKNQDHGSFKYTVEEDREYGFRRRERNHRFNPINFIVQSEYTAIDGFRYEVHLTRHASRLRKGLLGEYVEFLQGQEKLKSRTKLKNKH